MITLPQSTINAETLERTLYRLCGMWGYSFEEESKPQLYLAVKEDHDATNDDEGSGLHWHIMIGFGAGEKNRKSVDFEAIRKRFQARQPGCSVRCTPCTKGEFLKVMQDVVEYFLKQITVVTLGRQRNQGRYLTEEEFSRERKDRYVGNWECCFALGLMGKTSIVKDPKTKVNEKVAALTNALLNGQSLQSIFEENKDDPELQGLLVQKMKYMFDFVNAMKQMNQKAMPEKRFPACPIFPGWAPIAHGDTLESAVKKTHLVIYGPPNTGKTSFVREWCKQVGAKMVSAPRGGMQKFNEEEFLAADVILVDDMIRQIDDRGVADENRILWSTLLNWTNGEFIVSVYKKAFKCKPKIIIITTNESPEDILPMSNPKYKAQIQARFHFWETKTVSKIMDPDEGNIFLHYCRSEKIGPFAPAELSVVEDEPMPMSTVEDIDDDVIEVDAPGCQSQKPEIYDWTVIPASDGEDEIPDYGELTESQEARDAYMEIGEAYEFGEMKAFWDARGPTTSWNNLSAKEKQDEAIIIMSRYRKHDLLRMREHYKELKKKLLSQEY